MKLYEGNEIVPFSFYLMSQENILDNTALLLSNILESESSYFLVHLKIKPTNNIKIFIDGDSGITIEKCVQINRKLYKAIEEKAIFADGDFSLEVSSPGIDEPLKLHRQYVKNIGRFIEIIFNDDLKKEGKLLAVTDTDITLEYCTGKGKNIITEQLIIPLNTIKTTTVQIKF